MSCRSERNMVVAHRVTGARSPKTSPKKKEHYGRQGLRARPWQSNHEWKPKRRWHECNLRPDATAVRDDALAPWGAAWRERSGAGGRAAVGPPPGPPWPRSRQAPCFTRTVLSHGVGSCLLSPEKRKMVPLQVQFPDINVHKLSCT